VLTTNIRVGVGGGAIGPVKTNQIASRVCLEHLTGRHGANRAARVSPNWWGKGMGELLLYLGLEYGRKRGATQTELWTSEDNIVLLKLYRKAGFRVVGGFAMYYIDLK